MPRNNDRPYEFSIQADTEYVAFGDLLSAGSTPTDPVAQHGLDTECECESCVFERAYNRAVRNGYAGVGESGVNSGRTFVICGAGGERCYSCSPYETCSTEDLPEDEDDDYAHYDEASEETESYSPTIELAPTPLRKNTPALFLPALPGRDIRLISFEQEIARGASSVARAMHSQGFAQYDEVLGYGSSHSANRRGVTFVHVERDSSCGGEVIYSKLNLNDVDAASKFGDAFDVVRNMIPDGDVKLDMHCGFHIHVDLKGFSMDNVTNLYHAHNFLEEILYYVGAANWSNHRTLVNDENYAYTTPKGHKSKGEIGNAMSADRYALNLSNYLGARRDCHCGAFSWSAWEECICQLGKATVEFRWPNATANPRKVHAFSSFVQALVSRAKSAAPGEFSELTDLCWSQRENRTHDEREIAYYDRIRWMSDNLSMTKQEWDSFGYCFKNAPIPGFSQENKDHLYWTVKNSRAAVSEILPIG